MTRYALLCGSAPNDYRQKKLNDLFVSLIDKDGWNVTCLANGTDELMLEYALNNILDGNAGDDASGVMLYFCTEKPVADNEEIFWLCGNEIRKDVIEYYQKLAEKCKIDFQVVYDNDCVMLSEEELGWEKVSSETAREIIC